MNTLVLYNAVRLLVVLSAGFGLALSVYSGLDPSQLKDFLGLIPKVITLDLLVVWVFLRWLWRWRIFRPWLVPFPNLNGTWTGHVQSDWVNPETNEGIGPIPAMLTIKQRLFLISCVMHSEEMKSDSYSEGFRIDADRQLKQMTYTYTSKPRPSVSQRSVPHDGTVLLDIVETPKLKLKGRYWTERETTGEIELEFLKKELLEEIPQEMRQHPMSKEKQTPAIQQTP